MIESARVKAVRRRDRLYRAVRDFLTARDYLEAPTPIRLAAPALEDYIDAVPSGDAWLRTSPELHLKRLLAAGLPRCYAIAPCFRYGEHGRLHRQEFTMLEWYRVDADYTVLREETAALLRALAQTFWGGPKGTWQGQALDLGAPPEVLTVGDAFRRYAGVEVADCIAAGHFEETLTEQVEPQLGRGHATFLTDYPIALGALARAKPSDPTVAERWELYLAGIELANAYSELTDAAEQRRRFAATAALRAADGRPVYPMDEAFLAALEGGLPDCTGCALGLDRLLMLLTDAPSLAETLPFDE